MNERTKFDLAIHFVIEKAVSAIHASSCSFWIHKERKTSKSIPCDYKLSEDPFRWLIMLLTGLHFLFFYYMQKISSSKTSGKQKLRKLVSFIVTLYFVFCHQNSCCIIYCLETMERKKAVTMFAQNITYALIIWKTGDTDTYNIDTVGRN